MAHGPEALTDKEKETLRLLVSGYDAKSMAQHLGLSVHTINERLRDARRKMATSSSREAARLLRQAEAQDPELFGDKHLGDAMSPVPPTQRSQPVQGRGITGRNRWIVGGIVMSASLALLAFSLMPGPSLAPAVPVTTTTAVLPSPASEEAAVAAAQQFLALVDRDDWAASWRATHKSFQLLNTVEWWADASQKVRADVGTVRSRELATVNFIAAPPHGSWQVTFRASYSKKPSTTETLSLALESGVWKVVAITVD